MKFFNKEIGSSPPRFCIFVIVSIIVVAIIYRHEIMDWLQSFYSMIV